MTPTPAVSPSLGFLTVLQEASGYLGGYLVTNVWGRPLEFRLSTAVQPNRVQQILYGETLVPYVCADLIGKTLVDKAGVPVQAVFTDREAVLDLRCKFKVPVAWLALPDDPKAAAFLKAGAEVRPSEDGGPAVFCHPRYLADVPALRQLLDKLDGSLDLAEPFGRIREAVAEARKLGVTRAA